MSAILEAKFQEFMSEAQFNTAPQQIQQAMRQQFMCGCRVIINRMIAEDDTDIGERTMFEHLCDLCDEVDTWWNAMVDGNPNAIVSVSHSSWSSMYIAFVKQNPLAAEESPETASYLKAIFAAGSSALLRAVLLTENQEETAQEIQQLILNLVKEVGEFFDDKTLLAFDSTEQLVQLLH